MKKTIRNQNNLLKKRKLISICLFILFIFSLFTPIAIFAIYPNIVSLLNSVDSSKVQNWIRQRTFSIEFVSSQSISYGTTWITKKISKDENDFKYYLATNMHVISGVLKTKSQNLVGSNNQNDYELRNDIQIKLNRSKDPSKFLPSNSKGVYTDTISENIQNYDVSIIKLGFFENKNAYKANLELNYGQHALTTNYFQLPLIDLAILEFNFNNYPNMKQWLKQHYNSNPTVFYESNLDWNQAKNDNLKITENEIHIGGFPFDFVKQIPEFRIVSSKRSTISDGSNFINDYNNNNSPEKITSNKSDKNIYQDVARNILLHNTNLDGGASGSPAVIFNNSDNTFKVIGIFWGVVEFNLQSLTYSLIDLLYTSEYVARKGISKFPDYNFLKIMK